MNKIASNVIIAFCGRYVTVSMNKVVFFFVLFLNWQELINDLTGGQAYVIIKKEIIWQWDSVNRITSPYRDTQYVCFPYRAVVQYGARLIQYKLGEVLVGFMSKHTTLVVPWPIKMARGTGREIVPEGILIVPEGNDISPTMGTSPCGATP